MSRQWPFVAAFLGSGVILLLPAPDLPQGPEVSDKFIHGVIFAVLLLTGWFARFLLPRLFLALVAWAAATEILQAVLPFNRTGDVLDWAADVVGLTVALVVVLALERVRQ